MKRLPPITRRRQRSLTVKGLEPRQLTLYRKLSDKNSMLANAYLGAIQVLSDKRNTDRLTLAAHGFRELMEKFPLYVNIGIRPPVPMGNKINELKRIWGETKQSSCCRNNSWEGEIDGRLNALLKAVDAFFEWHTKEMPNKTEQVIKTLRELDPSKRRLPCELEKLNAQLWRAMNEYFQGVAHHGNLNTSYDEFSQYVYALESFLVERVAPRTFDDTHEIDSILGIR